MRKHSKRRIFILPFLVWAMVLGSALLLTGLPTDAAENPTPALSVGADAVNIKIKKHYTVAADGSYTLHFYVKRRILTYKGKKEHADFKFTYNQAFQSVKLLKGETITAKNEVIGVKSEEIHDIPAPWNSEASIYAKSRQLVVSLPAVEPGSEVEIELEIRATSGFWCEECFRLFDPIIDKEVIIDCPDSLALKYQAPEQLPIKFKKDKIADHKTRYHWRGKNIPALTPERWAPAQAEQGFCLLVSSFADWRQIADFFNGFFEKAAAQKEKKLSRPDLIGTNSPTNPLSHQLYRRMRDLTTYAISFQDTDFAVQSPAETKRLGYGTSCDLALLFTTQLQERQQKAHILMVNNRGRFVKKFADLPYPGWWDSALVENAGEFFIFTNDKPAPGLTGFDDHWALDLEKGKLVQVKDLEKALIKTELTLKAENLPESHGNLKLTIKGSAATSWRAGWRDLSPPEREIAFSQLLYEIHPQASPLTPLTIKGLKNDLEELVFSCDFKIEKLFDTLPGKTAQIIMPLKAPDLPLPYQTLLKDRQQPLAINDNLVIIDRTTLLISDNLHISEWPASTSGNLPQFRWQVSGKIDEGEKSLTSERKLEFSRGLIAASTSNYADFIKAIRKLYRPEALRIMLIEKNITNKLYQ